MADVDEWAAAYEAVVVSREVIARSGFSGKFREADNPAAGAASGRDVFDYLLDDRVTSQEMEQTLTEHLRRTGAYLAPGVNIEAVPRPAHARYELVASVIIPVNQRPEFIGAAIESVQSQTLPEVEAIIVVNGGPNDPTIPVVRRYLPEGDRY
ncbi:MAG: glycosyltransferase, partial [Planctomycetes bacterium]|nr:glycosyltransferase [Planctomycetota bacterium]